MNFLNKFSAFGLTAMTNTFMRVLCLLIIEYDCARLVQQSSGRPAVLGNYILASIFLLGFILMIMNLRVGYLIAMGGGIINIIAKIVIISGGHEHYPYWPIVWISQSLVVAYFSYAAYREFSSSHTA
jgi:hypothetical protein